jgi:hypothetical protein
MNSTTEEHYEFKKVARQEAYNHRGQYPYCEGASSPSWEPHAWVLEAMARAYELGRTDFLKDLSD